MGLPGLFHARPRLNQEVKNWALYISTRLRHSDETRVKYGDPSRANLFLRQQRRRPAGPATRSAWPPNDHPSRNACPAGSALRLRRSPHWNSPRALNRNNERTQVSLGSEIIRLQLYFDVLTADARGTRHLQTSYSGPGHRPRSNPRPSPSDRKHRDPCPTREPGVATRRRECIRSSESASCKKRIATFVQFLNVSREETVRLIFSSGF
jgi:hypothetical protein